MYEPLDTDCEGNDCPIDMEESPCPFVYIRKEEPTCTLIQLINKKLFKLKGGL